MFSRRTWFDWPRFGWMSSSRFITRESTTSWETLGTSLRGNYSGTTCAVKGFPVKGKIGENIGWTISVSPGIWKTFSLSCLCQPGLSIRDLWGPPSPVSVWQCPGGGRRTWSTRPSQSSRVNIFPTRSGIFRPGTTPVGKLYIIRNPQWSSVQWKEK